VATITSNTYGKTRVRLTYVTRSREPHEVRELSVAILLEGEFTAAYKEGDNTNVLPTDTMKNTVYVLARRLAWNSIETLAQGIAHHFLERLSHVSQVSVDIEETSWQHITGHGAAFTQSGNERRTTRLQATRSRSIFTAGVNGLHIMKTADSGFVGFLKDEFTTLPETHDRLFATALKAEWQYAPREALFNDTHRRIRAILLDCFAQHKSLSVQHTLFAMGEAVLNGVETVDEIDLVMPNKHCLLVDLARFGMDNPNMVFTPTDEPSGYIEARMVRDHFSGL
jgi:urate oxidase